jgi:hypothetical protein
MCGGPDPMLLERELCFSVPPSRAIEPALDTSPPSTAVTVQASISTDHDEPTGGDIAVPALLACSEDRLDCFFDAIQKKPASPLLAAPTRLAVQPAPSAPLGAATQYSPITNLPEFRFPVVGRSYSCAASTWWQAVVPQVLISVIIANDRFSRVKPANTGQT